VTEYDIIVIGGGSGGSAAVGRLCEDGALGRRALNVQHVVTRERSAAIQWRPRVDCCASLAGDDSDFTLAALTVCMIGERCAEFVRADQKL
jgi:hypothetical protein